VRVRYVLRDRIHQQDQRLALSAAPELIRPLMEPRACHHVIIVKREHIHQQGLPFAHHVLQGNTLAPGNLTALAVLLATTQIPVVHQRVSLLKLVIMRCLTDPISRFVPPDPTLIRPGLKAVPYALQDIIQILLGQQYV
jgi:hypothetical protein